MGFEFYGFSLGEIEPFITINGPWRIYVGENEYTLSKEAWRKNPEFSKIMDVVAERIEVFPEYLEIYIYSPTGETAEEWYDEKTIRKRYYLYGDEYRIKMSVKPYDGSIQGDIRTWKLIVMMGITLKGASSDWYVSIEPKHGRIYISHEDHIGDFDVEISKYKRGIEQEVVSDLIGRFLSVGMRLSVSEREIEEELAELFGLIVETNKISLP